MGCRAAMADGGYRGSPDVITSYRKHSADQEVPPWQEELNAPPPAPKPRRACTGEMKTWNVVRDYRSAASTFGDNESGIAAQPRSQRLTANLQDQSQDAAWFRSASRASANSIRSWGSETLRLVTASIRCSR